MAVLLPELYQPTDSRVASHRNFQAPWAKLTLQRTPFRRAKLISIQDSRAIFRMDIGLLMRSPSSEVLGFGGLGSHGGLGGSAYVR